MTDGFVSMFAFIGFWAVVFLVFYGISKIKKEHIKKVKEDMKEDAKDIAKNWKSIPLAILGLLLFAAFWGILAWIAASCNPLNNF